MANPEVTTQYNKNNPFLARLTERRSLTKPGSLKDTRHFVVDISGSGLEYECGDSLGVFVENRPSCVDGLLEALGFSGDETVEIPKTEGKHSIREALSAYFAINMPTKKFLLSMQERVGNEEDKANLMAMLEQDPEDLKGILLGNDYQDLLKQHSSVKFTPQDFIAQLRRLVPRLYSIASAPKLYPYEIHLTISIVRYQSGGRERIGVASTYLAERCPLNEAELPVFVAKSKFGLPEDSTQNIIMIGPGTGVAPFRAFVQQRGAEGAKGENWLFFGEQRNAYDFLYQEDWEDYQKKGWLHRLDLAFSRDQEEKIYVQNRLLENAAEIWKWLEGGAYFYVCGDAKRMAPDVHNALIRICVEQGKMTEEKAEEYLKLLRKQKRYQKDVY